jgi:hypothetical protein
MTKLLLGLGERHPSAAKGHSPVRKRNPEPAGLMPMRYFEGEKVRHLHFTPTSASWLNMVERFFAEITRNRIRRGTFNSRPPEGSATYSSKRPAALGAKPPEARTISLDAMGRGAWHRRCSSTPLLRDNCRHRTKAKAVRQSQKQSRARHQNPRPIGSAFVPWATTKEHGADMGASRPVGHAARGHQRDVSHGSRRIGG